MNEEYKDTETKVKEEKDAEAAKKADEAIQIEEGEEPSTLIREAHIVAQRIEEANARHEQNLNREEALQVRRALGGKSDAGQVPPQKLEETPQEYKNRIMSGELN